MSETAMRRALAALGTGCLLATACGDAEESRTTGAPMGASSRPEAGASTSLDEAPRILRVDLEPRTPRPGEPIRARVEAEEPEGQALRFAYEWRVDGNIVQQGPEASMRLGAGATRGTEVEVRVVASDPEEQRSQPASASVRVGNSPPVLHDLAIDPPTQITARSDVTVHPQASDADGDELSFDYRWSVNGETVASSGATLPAEHFSGGDSLAVVVTASDGQAKSEALRSKPIPVGNAPPRITSTPGRFDEEGRFVYKVEAEDPDGDTRFRYRLVEGPPGMEIDSADGTVRWTPREDQAGRHPVRIQLTDSKGARATQSFAVTLDFAEVEEGGAPPAAVE